jgi:hypothetical protein|nr:MAG TPA: hypothetical protein [Caudoviricetes sp.]
MERLTFDGNFCDIALCSEVRYGSFCEDGSCSQRRVWERLKSIEDILGGDYNLDRFRELVQADREGRCVVTELAPGDEVWVVERDEDGNPDDFSGYIFITSVRGIAIVSPSINGCADSDFLLSDFVEETAMSGSGDFSGYPIGDCYGTCEEAKAALREAEG